MARIAHTVCTSYVLDIPLLVSANTGVIPAQEGERLCNLVNFVANVASTDRLFTTTVDASPELDPKDSKEADFVIEVPVIKEGAGDSKLQAEGKPRLGPDFEPGSSLVMSDGLLGRCLCKALSSLEVIAGCRGCSCQGSR